MRIIVHDPAGHPFQVALARELARRGHQVVHIHCDTFSAARGGVGPAIGDPSSLSFSTVSHRRPFNKYSWPRRIMQEVEYGHRVGRLVSAKGAEVVLSCNTPLLSQALLTWRLRRAGIASVAWVQDLYSEAARDVLGRLPRWPAVVLGRTVERIEAWSVRSSDRCVIISESFRSPLRRWGVDEARVDLVPNWAPLEEIDVRHRPTNWEVNHGVEGKFVFMYTGILGLKHDPEVLADLAVRFRGRAEVVVVAGGPGSEWLGRVRMERHIDNLHIHDFQPYAVYPDVLGSADVLITLLTEQSGRYSVPSKVLSYLCAGRPVLGVLPAGNDAAAVIERSKSGVVVDPGDTDGFLDVAEQLFRDTEYRATLGAAARRHAEREFSTASSADAFERILEQSKP